MDLFDKLRQRKATVGLVGLGYVDLPLAAEFARAGFQTVGYDIDRGQVQPLQAGRNYIPQVGDGALSPLVRGGRQTTVVDYSSLEDADAVSICVPTPLGKTKDPDISYILATANGVAAFAHRGQFILFESTTYPGTLEASPS